MTTTRCVPTILGLALLTTGCPPAAINHATVLSAPIGPTSQVPEIDPGTTVNLRGWTGRLPESLTNRQYDADGLPDLAGPSFPFPGFRKYSVVFLATSNSTRAPDNRLKFDTIQGGKRFSFRTKLSDSFLEFCYDSDIPLLADHGAFRVDLKADASQAIIPPP